MSQDFYVEENLQATREEITPSGVYKLVIRQYATKPGSWHYSRGTVYRLSDGKEVCDIKRNYGAFTRSYVVKDGQEFLITGRSYLTQTIVNLDTGEEFNNKTPEEAKGHEFCWAHAELNPAQDILIVSGCYWAAPYEYKFFDFADPSKGWPELGIVEDGETTYLEQDFSTIDTKG